MNQRKYEAFYIVAGNHTDEKVQEIADKFKAVVESRGGTVESAGKWDKRKLAFEVMGQTDGNYILMNFESTSDVPAELNRQMRNDDIVLRHRVFSRDDEKAETVTA